MPGVKDRLIVGIGRDTIDRPRRLQHAAGQDEHHVVHVLYLLHEQGLVDYKRKRGKDSPGVNLSDIHLTSKGLARYEELTRDR